MTFKPFYAAAALVLLAASASQANAAPSIDTGAPTDFSSSLSLGASSWIAGEVSFDQASQIQSINAYLNDSGAGGTFTIALYSETANLPDTLINSWTGSSIAASNAWAWAGVSNLNQSVAAGKYWVALEVQGNDSSYWLAATQPAHPLAKYAFNDGSYMGYQAMTQSFGLQVAAVPEPEQLALLLAGLGIIGASSRRKAKTAA